MVLEKHEIYDVYLHKVDIDIAYLQNFIEQISDSQVLLFPVVGGRASGSGSSVTPTDGLHASVAGS